MHNLPHVLASQFVWWFSKPVHKTRKTKFFARTEKILYSKFPMFYTVFHFLTLFQRDMQLNLNQIMALTTVGAVFGVFRIFGKKKSNSFFYVKKWSGANVWV